MINKFKIILGSMLLASVTVISCNDSSTKVEETKTDTVATEKMMDTPPAVIDTTKKMDTAAEKPIIKTGKTTP